MYSMCVCVSCCQSSQVSSLQFCKMPFVLWWRCVVQRRGTVFWAERIVKGFSASLSFYAENSNENKDKTETKVKPKNKSVQDTV